MREIKFRAWLQEERRMMVEIMEISFAFEGNGEFRPDQVSGLVGEGQEKYITYGAHYSSDIILLQFTGLQDKNGKDTYEGDIVRYDSQHKKGWVTQVIFDESGSWYPFNDPYHTEDEQGDWFTSEFEIIGNLHENPELLK